MFQSAGTYTIVFGGNHTTDRLHLDAGIVTFDLAGGTLTLLKEADDTGVSVHIGETQSATLKILNGSVLAKDSSIGRYFAPGDPGAQLVIGNGARWSAFEHFVATGDTGNGSLRIQDGGIFEHGHGWAGGNPDVAGTISVAGDGSQWDVTGWYGLGTSGRGDLNISSAGAARIGVCEIAVNEGSSGQTIVDGAGSAFSLLSGEEVSLYAGKAGAGTVIVRNGASLQSYGHVHVGGAAGAAGSLSIRDADSLGSIARTLVIGVASGATGSVEVAAGAVLNVTGRGAGDPDDHVGLEVGREGEGTLNVRSAGYVSNDYITTIGAWSGGKGYALVDGDDSVLQANYQLEVGRSGTGTLMIRNGGRVCVTQDNPDPLAGSKGLAWVGGDDRGDIFVTGTGTGGAPSLLETAAQIQIGLHSIGNMVVSDGARVTSVKATSPTGSSGLIGLYADADGTVLVQDGNSRWIQDGTLNVGMSGRGTLRIENGGLVESVSGCIGRSAGGIGTAIVSGAGSTWALSGSLFINGTDTTPNIGGAARLVIGDGGAVSVSGITRVWNDGRIDYNGGVFSAGTLQLESAAQVLLGAGGDKVLRTRAVWVTGTAKLDLSDNDMIIDYDGDTPLSVIRGYIASARNGGFWNGSGITTSSGDASTFGLGCAEAAELGETLFHDEPVDSTSVLIKFTYYGDANLDGAVDIRDLYQLGSHWKTDNDWYCGDFNYDGHVDVQDLTLLAMNWQAGVGSPLGGSLESAIIGLHLPLVVPEPLGLCLAPLMLMLLNRRRKWV
jgi:T5SS/PEP-CTERM-associated repeat protein